MHSHKRVEQYKNTHKIILSSSEFLLVVFFFFFFFSGVFLYTNINLCNAFQGRVVAPGPPHPCHPEAFGFVTLLWGSCQ